MLLFGFPSLTLCSTLAMASVPITTPMPLLVADTVTQSDTVQPVFTEEGLAKIKAFLGPYYKNPLSVLDSTSLYRMIVPLPPVAVKGMGPLPRGDMHAVNMIAFAKYNTTIAGNLKAAGLTPEEYIAWRRAVTIAYAISQADQILNGGAGRFDVTTTAGKNARFLNAHAADITELKNMGWKTWELNTSDISKSRPIFTPLMMLPPSQMRLANGAPGPKYWQNRSDYDLKVTLDTGTQMITGSMTLRYTNNSPNVLKTLVLQNEQNKGTIDRFDQVVGTKSVALTPQKPGGDEYMLQVTLAEPLRPGKTATFQVAWHFEMPPGGGLRMGRDMNLYQVAQWYPRPSVYDDVKGWNMESYATNAEFYLDYGDYTLEVTLPAGFIVAATGTLDNPKDVLAATQLARLAQAATADTVIHIITQAELENGTARPTNQGMLTWKFHAKNTRDVAWAASPNYQWDATQWHGILIHAFYRPSRAFVWSDAADQTRMSIQEYSERWFQYPYPQATAVEGPVPGMEYPMLAMEAGGDSKTGLYGVVTHEVGHNWFPMIVGSNERMHAWMDEGFNTFINTFSEALRYPASGDQAARIAIMPFNGQQATLETGNPTGNSDGAQYFGTAAVLQILRRDVLGEAVFDKAFKTYIKRWAFKHPTPMDFFRTMENVSGRKLDWFWRECFLESPVFDQAIDSVTQTTQGGKTTVTVQYGNKGRAVFPLLVQFTFSDGTTQNKTYPVDVWQKNPNTYSVSSKFDKTVRTIAIDPEHHLPDADPANNRWTAK